MFQLLLVGALLNPLFVANEAQACGGFYHEPGLLAESQSFEAIFEAGDGQVRADYRVLYSGDAADFGWVLPFPGAFVSLADGSSAAFDDLREGTAPDEDLVEPREPACRNDKGLANDGGGFGDTGSAVEVVGEGFTGTYDYLVLEADSADALVDWLEERGWDLGESATAVDAYVADGVWRFLAIELAVTEGEEQTSSRELPPISLVYEGDSLIYPARMARSGLTSSTHTTLYVKGDQRARISAGWTEIDVDLLWDDGEDPDYMRYSAWPEALAELGGEGSFGVVYAGEWEDGWLTRFETVADPEFYDNDVTFLLDAGTDATVHTLISNRGGCNAPEGAALLWLGPGLWFLGRRRQRSA
jgi:Uncharacterized protein conserved in bacteria (DUF2330)